MTKLNTMGERLEEMGAKMSRGMHGWVDHMEFSHLIHDYIMDLQRVQSLISHMSRDYAELYDRALGYLKGLYALGENRLTVEVLPPEVLARYLERV